jgi:hypothetical protein
MTIFRFESEALFAFIERIEHPNSPTTWRRYKTRET